jgi:hypothetical protein
MPITKRDKPKTIVSGTVQPAVGGAGWIIMDEPAPRKINANKRIPTAIIAK